MLIIGLSGKRGSGKSTLANYLENVHGFVQVHFADEIRNFAAKMFPFKSSDFSDIKKKQEKFMTYDWSPREFLLNLGQFMRYHDADYWLKKGLANCNDNSAKYVIDDVRFLNEADTIRSTGYGKLVRVNRFVKDNPYGVAPDIDSETQLDNYKFDYVVEDCWNTSLTGLKRQADSIVDTFCKV